MVRERQGKGLVTPASNKAWCGPWASFGLAVQADAWAATNATD